MKKKLSLLICMILVLWLNIAYNIDLDNLKQKNYDTSIVKTECILSKANKSEAAANLNLYAKSAVLIDADTNRILYDKNSDIQLPMASTTKIMTCICALENSNLEDEVTISKKAAAQPKVKLGVKEGDKFKLKDLLLSLMLESHNDAAVAIAEHVSGSVEEFAKLMNQKARDIGCFNTYFITPNGLDAEVTINNKSQIHHTTAVELAKIMNYCVYSSPKKDLFLEITRTPSHSFNEISKGTNYSAANHNAALNAIEGAISGKTGFTNAAGYCYIGCFERNEKKFIVALLACGWPNNKNYKWQDTKSLLNYGDSFYNLSTLKKDELSINKLSANVINCGTFADDTKKIKLYPEINFENKILLSAKDTEKIVYMFPKTLKKSIKKDEIIGYAYYYVNDYVVFVSPLKSENTLKDVSFKECFYEVLKEIIM